MKSTDAPSKQAVPFGSNGPREAITATTPSGSNQASYDQGFPPITMTLKSAGGLPPKGQDMNQILFEQSSFNRYFSSGGGYQYDSSFSSAIGGYPAGARIPNSTNTGFWLNTVDDNSADPENSTAALTGWVPSGFYGVTSITGLAGYGVTLSTLQAGRDRIVLSGSLTSSINLVVPAWIKKWEVINNCTGQFSVTVKTPSGSGVAVPAGSTATLFGDGVNITTGYAPGTLLNVQRFTASGAYTPTVGTKKIVVEVQAAGGGGGRTGYTATDKVSIATGGGGGGYAKSQLLVSDITAPLALTVGTGGAVGTTSPGNGTKGGDSTFGSLITCTGGTGGYGQAQAVPPLSCTGQLGGSATGGNLLNIPGCSSGGGNSPSLTSSLVSNGGDSVLGAGGFSPTNTNVNGGDARGYGAGGGGCNSAAQPSASFVGGKGSDGIIIVWEYA